MRHDTISGNNSNEGVALITGASSGFGEACACCRAKLIEIALG